MLTVETRALDGNTEDMLALPIQGTAPNSDTNTNPNSNTNPNPDVYLKVEPHSNVDF